MSDKRRVFCSACGKRRYEERMQHLPNSETGHGNDLMLCKTIGKHGDNSKFSCYEFYIFERVNDLKRMYEAMEQKVSEMTNRERKLMNEANVKNRQRVWRGAWNLYDEEDEGFEEDDFD